MIEHVASRWDAIAALTHHGITLDGLSASYQRAKDVCIEAIENGHKLMFCGNGGSAAQCLHAVGELVGAFLKRNRPPLPAIALCTDITVLTAIANDYGYDEIFARQVDALGQRGDVLLCLSTSGESMNCIKAAHMAIHHGVKVISFTGSKSCSLWFSSSYTLQVPAKSIPRIQEVHLILLHMLCEELEIHFFGSKTEEKQQSPTMHSGHGNMDVDTERANRVVSFLDKYLAERWNTGIMNLSSACQNKLMDLGADSLDTAELAFSLEDEFEVDIADIYPSSTIQDVVDMVLREWHVMEETASWRT